MKSIKGPNKEMKSTMLLAGLLSFVFLEGCGEVAGSHSNTVHNPVKTSGTSTSIEPTLVAQGSTAGQRDDFAYSKAMSASGIVWDMDTLSAYIENPRKYMPGNRMSYAGLRKAEDRAALLVFLQRETQPK